jgi:hypothetical protein
MDQEQAHDWDNDDEEDVTGPKVVNVRIAGGPSTLTVAASLLTSCRAA